MSCYKKKSYAFISKHSENLDSEKQIQVSCRKLLCTKFCPSVFASEHRKPINSLSFVGGKSYFESKVFMACIRMNFPRHVSWWLGLYVGLKEFVSRHVRTLHTIVSWRITNKFTPITASSYWLQWKVIKFKFCYKLYRKWLIVYYDKKKKEI